MSKIFLLFITLLFLAQVMTVQAGPFAYAACVAMSCRLSASIHCSNALILGFGVLEPK